MKTKIVLLLLFLQIGVMGTENPSFSYNIPADEQLLSDIEYQPIKMVVISPVNAGELSLFNSNLIGNDLFLSEDEPLQIIGKALPYPSPMKWSEGGIIGYRLNQSSEITLRVYDMRGVEIVKLTFLSEELGGREGYNRVPFNKEVVGYDLPTGVYTYLVMSGDSVLSKNKVGVVR